LGLGITEFQISLCSHWDLWEHEFSIMLFLKVGLLGTVGTQKLFHKNFPKYIIKMDGGLNAE